MTRPTKHPKSGVYRVRVAIPATLRDTAVRVCGRRSELIENLGTKNQAEARRLAPPALARLQGMLDGIRKFHAGDPPPVTERDIQALAGEDYRSLMADHGDDPGDFENLQEGIHAFTDQLEQIDEDPHVPRQLRLRPDQLDHARVTLRRAGLLTGPETVMRLAEAQWTATYRALSELLQRAGGDWTPSRTAELYPTQTAAASASASCTFDALLRGWGLDKGWPLNAKPINRNLYDRLRTMERLANFLGHRNANTVTKADAVRWKAEAQQRGLSAATIRNDVSEMSAIWKWGLANGMPLPHGNPFADILPAKPKRQATQRPFTDAEAVAILRAARARSGLLRWLPWVCCLTGARLTEVVQSVREDLFDKDGVFVIRFHDEGDDGRSLKNADSRRTVPLHPALIAEGFLAYVQALPAGSPLFPDVARGAMFGRRSDTAGPRVSYWLKHTLGITDRAISPNHSWRHWFADACRKAAMHPEIRSALTGHSAKLDESSAYGHGMGSFVALLAENIAKVKAPLPPP